MATSVSQTKTLRFREVRRLADAHTIRTKTTVLRVPNIMFFPFYLDASRSYFIVAPQIKVIKLALSSKIRMQQKLGNHAWPKFPSDIPCTGRNISSVDTWAGTLLLWP